MSVYTLLHDQNFIGENAANNSQVNQWLESITSSIIYDTFKKLIDDNLVSSNQFRHVVSSIISNCNARIVIQHSRYNNDANLLIHLLNTSMFNDKFVILCTEIYKKHIIQNNNADNRGFGVFENGILMGYNLDALYALPCNNRTDPIFLNKWLLYSYVNNQNNVLKYMIRRNIAIKKPYKIIRLIIFLSTSESNIQINTFISDLKLLIDSKLENNIDNYGNTPIMIAKAFGNNKAEELLLKYNPDLNHKNIYGATYHNLILRAKITHDVNNKRMKSVLKTCDTIGSNIKPYQTWSRCITWFIIKNIVFLVILVLYHLI